MAILKRFGDIMRANINALLDKAEDPGKMVDQMLLDLNEDLAAVKKETASVMAAATSARQQVDECKANIAKYEAAAKSAVKAGNDDDARKLLSTKQQYESTLTSLEEAAKVAEDNAAKMRQMHDKLVSDINGLQARRAAIHAKVSVANAQQHVNAATEKTSRTSRSTAAFDRMEEKADRMLNEANATAELNTQATNEDIANKYLSGGSASVEDELARLKAEVGVEEQQQAEQ
ncbi:phage-shock protein [Bifidobacterium animalis subsp. animalis MCC 1489]|uniref:Phage-shock protein n=2 Tax=Bifidobacterium animalis subsp. animalis TaxID=302912 RepID=A0AB34T5V0_9BIFI|nr:PspA/IM30 family protein [Bifidobacterium animalis]AFI63472.1 phage shock protein A-like protein [Bifidobacterium animalis subsp. animalis ATCC 25527]ARE60179.1 phage shock protein A [Bifidobacterium animalis subsp. animalis]AYN24099.1 phage shock protein A-like protein [Bifidobacterium animalis subsp. animalis]KFI41652.1 phage shock protein A-like protein [Bifidobacterium animalis subsp. animalis]KOA48258.1 phage-shock protein [Bifidobacterium animalis subsp. animalis MCC 0483]